jgi:hypothetical protein
MEYFKADGERADQRQAHRGEQNEQQNPDEDRRQEDRRYPIPAPFLTLLPPEAVSLGASVPKPLAFFALRQ